MKTMMFTKNDIWRVLGIILLVGGQFMTKESFSGFGVTLESNLVQIVGATLLLLPFALRAYALIKNKKESNTDSQG
ncbi:MAG: hypothetical protein IPL26_13145 [Leptospiraceae bacterium]|nr:hypothetical protein [Leptospiraceae bacterium]